MSRYIVESAMKSISLELKFVEKISNCQKEKEK